MEINVSKRGLENTFRSLHFYCIRWDTSINGPEYVDVMEAFKGDELYDALITYKSVKDYAELDRWVKLVLRMKFHLKAEMEFNVCEVVSPSIDDLNRIDVYDQLVPNVSMFVDMINEKCNLNFPKMETKKENMIIPMPEI